MRIVTMVVAAVGLAMPSMTGAQDWTPAQERRLSPVYSRCVGGAAGATFATIDCNSTEHELQDARLNQAYRMVMGRLSTPRRAALRTSQRGWIGMRDRTCQQHWDEAGGGQASDLERSSCLLRRTIARTLWLERYR